ncbi:hypothetical protein HNR60_002591 [Rhodopseudomonas rhenobacensis]|uniref:Uncharacterized protein n=1 Tax=Rhodopseudomonas rhenobacensis TaxID=87461 RepID=A0A7W7Z4J8_9BRAD|nr:hypothetical protein [Rhodopseudomonas rhenobacensis]MBB5047834.1 hypothetical protein [Rhodopseudomonas rhenobacensis]
MPMVFTENAANSSLCSMARRRRGKLAGGGRNFAKTHAFRVEKPDSARQYRGVVTIAVYSETKVAKPFGRLCLVRWACASDFLDSTVVGESSCWA